MNLADIKKLYFIGIGGIGMSALARYFHAKGVEVKGYDRTETALTQQLKKEGIDISFVDESAAVDANVDAVVYTPAIPQDNKIWLGYQATNIPLLKRSEMLQAVTDALTTIAVAGSHGKTTTSTMIAYLLKEAGAGCNAFLGGISANFQTNFWSSDNPVAVVEADEYDRSFLKLNPAIAVLTSMDADHLDIYGTEEACQDAFIGFTQKIKPEGALVVKHGLKRMQEMGGSKKISYSLQQNTAQAYASNILLKDGSYIFDIIHSDWMLQGVHLNMGGMHNVENCVAAVTVAKLLDLDDNAIKAAVASFKGVKRRFEYVLKNEKIVFIDDYAHHPEELKSLLRSVKTLFSKRRLVVAFQPHLYTRTRDFAQGFADALDMADEVILLDIYPARELPIEGVQSQMIADRMGNPNVTLLSKEGLLNYAAAAPLDLLVTAGAGDIDKLVPELKTILEKKG